MSERLTKAGLIEHIKAADQRAREYTQLAASDRTRIFLAALLGRLDYQFPDVANALAQATGMDSTNKGKK